MRCIAIICLSSRSSSYLYSESQFSNEPMIIKLLVCNRTTQQE
uniref:Uncharacterized protein n=1 Tax=Arundo donax TaxID=35708 RepID=A0A0A9D6X9_ARUDO